MKNIHLNALLSLLFSHYCSLLTKKGLYEFKFLLIWCLFLSLNVKLLSSLTNYESIRKQICALQIYKNFRIKQISQSYIIAPHVLLSRCKKIIATIQISKTSQKFEVRNDSTSHFLRECQLKLFRSKDQRLKKRKKRKRKRA